jgi:general secretion pathway protein L
LNAVRIDLNAPVTTASIQNGLLSFARWWSGQLLECIPAAVRRSIGRRFGRWTIVIDDPSWQLTSEQHLASSLSLDERLTDDALRARLEAVAPDSLHQRVRAVIPASSAMIRSVRLPVAAASHLRSVIKLQLDRLSPFRAEDVQFDVLKGAEIDGEIEAQVAIVPRSTLRALQDRLAGIGLNVGRFAIADTAFAFAPVRRHWTKQEQLQLGLGGVALAAWIAAFLLAPVMRDLEQEALLDEISQMRSRAHAAASLRDDVERIREPLAATAERLNQPDALSVLRLLTERIPNDSQLLSMTITGRDVRLMGFSSNVDNLVGALARSGLQPRLVEKPTQDAANFRRFDLTLKVAAGQEVDP